VSKDETLRRLQHQEDENMKVDVCIWTRNGEKTLPVVLQRIEQVIPNIGRKIAVDDGSTDNTLDILRRFGWRVYPNAKGFINGGTSEALVHVKSTWFVSVEQDVLLGPNWWRVMSQHLSDKSLAVAQGIERSTCRAEYAYERLSLGQWCSIGNNVYRTRVIRRLGFVDDTIMMKPFHDRILANNYRWVVDDRVESTHLHGGFLSAVNHTVQFYKLTKQRTYVDKLTRIRYLASIAFSPIKGFSLAVKVREPQVLILHIVRSLALWKVKISRGHRNFDKNSCYLRARTPN
jgi:glycosyltransferase involved in cell wall biosynthesis